MRNNALSQVANNIGNISIKFVAANMKRITLNESIGVVQWKRGGAITPC